jgi:hypothetical protein
MQLLTEKYQKLDQPFVDLNSDITDTDLVSALELYNNVITTGYGSPDIRLRSFAGCTWLRFPNRIFYDESDIDWYWLSHFLQKPIDEVERTVLEQTAQNYKPILSKVLTALSNKLGGKYLVHGVEINTLKPMQTIKSHMDKHYLDDQTHRVHLVLETNDQTFLTCGGETKNFPRGSLFIINNRMEHSGINNGISLRTHMVIDCVEYID